MLPEPDDRFVHDLPDLLQPGDLVVVNDTRVIPARLRLCRATVARQARCCSSNPATQSDATGRRSIRPARKLPPGSVLYDAAGRAIVEIGMRTAAGDTFVVSLLGSGDPLETLGALGEMPLPPYIHETLTDPERYQTVFAEEPASAAAPTAGLHLTADVLRRTRGPRHRAGSRSSSSSASTRSPRSPLRTR